MQPNEQCSHAAEQYYQGILRYCIKLLSGDADAAADCTQEVFLLMLQKRETLDFEQNIRGWLYAAAQRTVMDYRRRQERLAQLRVENPELLKQIPAHTAETEGESVFDVLTERELTLLEKYYSAKHGDRSRIAAEYGITVRQLYKRVEKIRLKLLRHIEKRLHGTETADA